MKHQKIEIGEEGELNEKVWASTVLEIVRCGMESEGCLYVCMYVCRWLCPCMPVWQPEVDDRWPPLTISALNFETNLESTVHRFFFGRLAGLWATGFHLPPLPTIEIIGTAPHQALTCRLRVQTEDFVFVQQALYPMSYHPHCPVFLSQVEDT